MNEVLQNILSRRSVRTYSDKQILEDELSVILEAGKFAPSGGNSQSWIFTVIQNKEILDRLNQSIRKAFKELTIDENTYKSKVSSKKLAEGDNFNFYYNAPTLVLVSNDRGYPNAMADSAAALMNMFLAANSLGVGSCYINQVTWMTDEPDVRKILTELGIPEHYVVCGSAALGYNSGTQMSAPPRKANTVKYIR